ncbi:MAG: pyridoxal-phosphate dependent enzyme [Acidimicrobiales bacterium]
MANPMLPTYADVDAAAKRLAGVVTTTPVLTASAVDTAAGAEVFLKAEIHQVTGSFKFRGASNAVALLSDAERRAGVVAFSSGNHAQAVARAAALAGSTSVIVMPHDAPARKRAATEAAGARIVGYDRYTEDRLAIARAIAADEGRALIPPFDHPPVIAGQGTAAAELHRQMSGLDALFVPVGGGGLLAGCCLATAALAPACAVYGVEPEAGDDHRRSRAAGHRVDIGVPDTIADGQQVATPGELTWAITNRLAADFVTATDAQIVDAMRLLFDASGLVVEPSGACALAAVLQPALLAQLGLGGRRIGVILSGGNVDPDRFEALTGRAIAGAGPATSPGS